MRHGRFLSMQLQYRWVLALLVLHILVLSITAAPLRKLVRKQDTTATKGDDVSFEKKKKRESGVLQALYVFLYYQVFNIQSNIKNKSYRPAFPGMPSPSGVWVGSPLPPPPSILLRLLTASPGLAAVAASTNRIRMTVSPEFRRKRDFRVAHALTSRLRLQARE